MKKNHSFFAGVATTLLVLAMGTSALAASGNVSFNFANVALNGEAKITADSDITAANGQKIPGSILYTDPAGGKTNYLPIRAISDLLGVEIRYDSASKTIHLGEQKVTQTASEHKWQKEVSGRMVSYTCGEEGHSYQTPPAWRPSWTAEGWTLTQMTHDTNRNYSAKWEYRGPDGSDMVFHCGSPSTAGFSREMSSEAAAKNCQTVAIQGQTADYYQDGTFSLLAWENSEGIFFFLTGNNVPQKTLTAAAESVKLCTETVEPCQLNWLPGGYSRMEHYALADTVLEYWVHDNVALTWMYAKTPLGLPAGEGAAEDIKGISGKFWEAETPYSASSGTIAVNGKPASSVNGVSSITIPSQKTSNTLAWQDPDTGVSYLLQGILEKDAMIRIAENVK